MANKISQIRKLTKKHDIFIHELILGKTQREALLIAYPEKKKLSINTINKQGYELYHDAKIQLRYEECLNEIREEEKRKALWSREKSINALKYIIDQNTADLDRIYQASEDELKFMQQVLSEQSKRFAETGEVSKDMSSEMAVILKMSLDQRKTRRISGVHNQGIVAAIAELNKMMGYNEETVNVNAAVKFVGADKLSDAGYEEEPQGA